MSAPKGYLSLILHAHLPYVRHPEYDDFLEEDWLFEAITETYAPLIEVFDGLVRDNVHFRITMSMSPSLISMLTDPLLQQRYMRYLHRLIELANKEIERHLKQVDIYKDALATANESIRKQNEDIKRQNEDIKRQNEEMKKLADDRNEIVAKYNKVVADFNDLASKWNELTERLKTNAPPGKASAPQPK